jgi:hypothetical protein
VAGERSNLVTLFEPTPTISLDGFTATCNFMASRGGGSVWFLVWLLVRFFFVFAFELTVL